jgi:hypothetical protein
MLLPIGTLHAAGLTSVVITNSIMPVIVKGAAATPLFQTYNSAVDGLSPVVVFGRNYDSGPITTFGGTPVPNGLASVQGIADLNTASFAIYAHSDQLTKGNNMPDDMVGSIGTTNSVVYSDFLSFSAPAVANSATTRVVFDFEVSGSMSADTQNQGSSNVQSRFLLNGNSASVSHSCSLLFVTCSDDFINSFVIANGFQATVMPGALSGNADVIRVIADLPVSSGVAGVSLGIELTADANGGTVDFAHTAHLNILTDPNVTWTSGSGFDFRPAAVPEPASVSLLLLGLGAIAGKRLRTGRRATQAA